MVGYHQKDRGVGAVMALAALVRRDTIVAGRETKSRR